MNTKGKFIPVAVLTFALYMAGVATAMGSMMCEGGIVSVGDTSGELLRKCGQPVSKSQYDQKKITSESSATRDRTVTFTTIDDWVFNFGPNQFQYKVLLENGRITKMESLDYGY